MNFQLNNNTAKGQQLQAATKEQYEQAKARGVQMHRVDASQVQKLPVDRLELCCEVQKGTDEEFRTATQGQQTRQIPTPGHRGFSAVG
ncbi:MAG: hypothetical protein JWM80_3179 [Cyanobacteria bacterium RYN_339]|nr:hypothetical protein [Cyanobacteria bacterium RYN_339]